GKLNTTGNYNMAVGFSALYNNTTGTYNTAVGDEALYSNKIGWENTAFGKGALFSNTGFYNTASGYSALNANADGDYNVANGVSSLLRNTSGSYNTALGADVMYYNTVGIANSAMGAYALFNNIGNYNTGLGYYALEATTGAYYNTAVGFEAGDSYDNGYNNVFVGANTDVNGGGYYNVIAIGQGTVCTDVNQARFGNSSTVSIGGWAGWTNISDGRVKKNIKQNVPGLTFINKLQPITYNLDLDAADKIIQHVRKDSTGKIIPLSEKEVEARVAKEKILYTGFVAQDVEKAAKNLNYDFSGVDAAKNDKSLYGLRYSDFVVPLVEAVQELSRMNDAKDSEINNLEARLSKLEAMVSANQSTVNSEQLAIVSSASLQQNNPNPFSNATTINYSLPKTYSSAKIIITNNNGVALKQINLSAKGKGSVNINASTLAAGAYQYSLYVDGKKIDTKQMISSK
ncbi:MAG TPA: tail fiber domain-containing protein, partial [Parafilimonas sp.]|nr:tail fiber domain-containing protein [Parafilimonas sp.]